MDEARARGVDVTIDAYPYTASSTSIQGALFPAWAQEGGRKQVLARLADPAIRPKIKAEIVRVIKNERGGGDPKNIVVANLRLGRVAGRQEPERRHRGSAACSRRSTMPPKRRCGWCESGGCQGVFHAIGEEDLERILRHPATMIGSDGEIPTFGKASPHPRSYGTFVRVLAVYARERKIITLADAVRKMTSFPAQRLGLVDRGLVRPGMKADLVVFDPARVRDLATFEKPHQYAEGISHVITNGQVVFEGGRDDRRPARRRCSTVPAVRAGGADVDPSLPALPRADPRERRRLPALRRGTARGARTSARAESRAACRSSGPATRAWSRWRSRCSRAKGSSTWPEARACRICSGGAASPASAPWSGPVEFVVRSDDAPRVRALLRDLASAEEARPSEDAE